MYSRDTGNEYLVCKLLSAPRKSGDFPGGKKKIIIKRKGYLHF